MKIRTIKVDHYQIPLQNTLTDSKHGEMVHFAVIVVRIKCVDGVEGMGYTYTVGKTGGYAIQAVLERDLVPFLIGKDAANIERLWEQMWWHTHYVGRGGITSFAISAIDIAFWDLKSRKAGLPLWQLLGGHSPKVRAYAGGIDFHLPIDKLVEQTKKNLEDGFRAIKMKVGRKQLAEDVERVATIRDIVGPDIPLMVDANMGWSVDQAIKASREFAKLDIYWFEEPTIPDDVEGHKRILTEGALPVAVGENYHTIYEFQKIIHAGAVSFPEPDISNCGGITVWMKVAHLAEAFNLLVTTHGIHDIHLHLLAAVPNSSFLEAHGFGLDAFIERPLEIVDGYATASDCPGHGVRFKWDKLEALRAPQ